MGRHVLNRLCRIGLFSFGTHYFEYGTWSFKLNWRVPFERGWYLEIHVHLSGAIGRERVQYFLKRKFKFFGCHRLPHRHF